MFDRKTVFQTSILPAPAETVWEGLQQIKTMQYICAPMVAFQPLSAETDALPWTEGQTYKFRILLFGVVPFGTQETHVEQIDRDSFEMRSVEHHTLIPVWDHTIRLRKINDANTLLADKIEIEAGWRTPAVYAWATRLVQNRHQKWRMIMETPDQKTPPVPETSLQKAVRSLTAPRTLIKIGAVCACAAALCGGIALLKDRL